MSLSSNRIWEQKLKGICILFRMVYGTRSSHGIRYNRRVCETRHTMHTKHTIYYGWALKTCILCIPNIPYTTGGYAQICVPRVLSILHTMDAIQKKIASQSGRMRTAAMGGWYMVCVVHTVCQGLRGLGWDVGRSR